MAGCGSRGLEAVGFDMRALGFGATQLGTIWAQSCAQSTAASSVRGENTKHDAHFLEPTIRLERTTCSLREQDDPEE